MQMTSFQRCAKYARCGVEGMQDGKRVVQRMRVDGEETAAGCYR